MNQTVLDEGSGYKITAFGPWLDLVKANEGRMAERNILKESFIATGYAWANKFLGRRFTGYVRGRPFFYHMGDIGAVNKFRRMGLLQKILDQEYDGWDPWSPALVPLSLINRYRRMYPEAKGVFSRSGNYFTLSRFIRREAKRVIKDIVSDLLYVKTRPLVQTGEAEKAALQGRRVYPMLTKGNVGIKITIPFGGARNALVGKIVRMMPDSEIAFCQKTLAENVSRSLNSKGYQAFTRGNHNPAPLVR